MLRVDDHARTFRLAGLRDGIAQPVHLSVDGFCQRRASEELSNHVNVAPPIVLTIAGFDPSAGAGVAADLKTFAAAQLPLRRCGHHGDDRAIHPGWR